jgi:hypothetical protein
MHEYRRFFDFRRVCPFFPVCPVEPISALYGQDGQEELLLSFAHQSDGFPVFDKNAYNGAPLNLRISAD